MLANPYHRDANTHGLEARENHEKSADGCETCDNRKYRDVSSDGSVSMQTPTKMNPDVAATAVAAHEQEHIRNDRIDAENSGREVIAQYVRLMNSICAECGRTYVSGGEATTVSATRADDAGKFNIGEDNPIGGLLDTAA
jgi:hypothetical protein